MPTLPILFPGITPGSLQPDLDAQPGALQVQVVAITGLADGQVIFSNQNARGPHTPADPNDTYVTIKMDGPFTVGGPKLEQTGFDPNQAPGKEVWMTAAGPAELNFSIQAFSKATIGGMSAYAMLAGLQIGLQLGVYRDALRAAGISIFDWGKVQNLAKVYGSAMEGRALLELRAYVQQAATFQTGYIATVDRPVADWEWAADADAEANASVSM